MKQKRSMSAASSMATAAVPSASRISSTAAAMPTANKKSRRPESTNENKTVAQSRDANKKNIMMATGSAGASNTTTPAFRATAKPNTKIIRPPFPANSAGQVFVANSTTMVPPASKGATNTAKAQKQSQDPTTAAATKASITTAIMATKTAGIRNPATKAATRKYRGPTMITTMKASSMKAAAAGGPLATALALAHTTIQSALTHATVSEAKSSLHSPSHTNQEHMFAFEDIWVGHIFPFLGMGKFALIAPVCKSMKNNYIKYCKTVKNPPKYKDEYIGPMPISFCNTFMSSMAGSLPCARFWGSFDFEFFQGNICDAAASIGSMKVFKWAHKRGYHWSTRTCKKAAKSGHLKVLEYAHENGCPWNEWTCSSAAKNGHLDVLKYAHENGCPWGLGEITCSSAARNGHLDVLKYAHENGCPWGRGEITCENAAYNGHLDVLKYAHENGCPWDEDTCSSAAENGHLDVLKYAHENGCPWDEKTCQYAAANGHLGVLKYAHENGCPWNELTCNAAAHDGHLDVLKYAHENGCPWDEWTSYAAAYDGHLDVLKYAHENGCPWDEGTCLQAAEGGHLDVLKYAHENGCPWDYQTYRSAIRPELREYVEENGCPR